MDYKELLKKYMTHLEAVEGSNFLGYPSDYLNDEELEELKRLSPEE